MTYSLIPLMKTSALTATIMFAGMTAAQATTVTINTEPGITMETEFGFRSDTGTRGVDLAGSQVTAAFDDGTSETVTWMAFDAFTFGGANGDRWSLFQGGDAITNIISDGRIMTSLTLDMSTSQSNTIGPDMMPVAQGASLFDILPEEDGSTVGSSFGFPFEFTFNAPEGTVDVTYSGAVNIVGQEAVGDLYTTMHIDFTGLDLGGFTGNSNYRTDQDTLLVAGDLRPTVAPVPLPAGLPLLALGLGAFGIARRRK